MSSATYSDALWSVSRFVKANVEPIATVYYEPPQEDVQDLLYVIFRTLRPGPLELVMSLVIRLDTVARTGVPTLKAGELASQVAGLFLPAGRRGNFPLYDKEANLEIGTCLVTRVDVEPVVHFPDGTDVAPVDVTFRFRSRYAPRV